MPSALATTAPRTPAFMTLAPASQPLLSGLAAGLFLAGGLLGPAPVRAGPGAAVTPAPILAVGPNEAEVSRRVDLTQGRSLVIDLPRDAKEVFVANPKVANAVVRSTRKVFVIGVENGATSIFVMDAEGRQIAALDVTVGRDLNVLRQTLATSLPGGRFDVRPAGESVLLTGTVNAAAEAQQAIDIANAFVGLGGAGGAVRGTVINNISIRGKDQVMLRVTVVEVSRTVLKQFGINVSGTWSGLAFDNTAPLALNAGRFPLGNGITGVIGSVDANGNFTGGGLKATLKAFEQAGVSRVLAEPTLTAISGEAAKFTAGGEIAVPGGLSCTASGAGATPSCLPGITFKPYGVSLSFTPVVLSENRISIRVGTDVTEIDQQNAFTYVVDREATAVPGFTVRKSETTVELASGATIMTAGLIQQKNRQAITGLPGLINLPVLGALFRSRDYQRDETELMIMVTPYIAKAMEAGQAKRPDDGFVEATDGQAVLLGRFNRLYGVVGAAPLAAKTYRGRFGFITD